MTRRRFEAGLPRRADAAWTARRLLATWFGRALETNELDTAKLLASELVNNAVLHGKGDVQLRADLNDDRLCVEVIDEGNGFEHTVREFDLSRLDGRGLAIVDAEASRWGIYEGTTHVWFELDDPARASPRPTR